MSRGRNLLRQANEIAQQLAERVPSGAFDGDSTETLTLQLAMHVHDAAEAFGVIEVTPQITRLTTD